MVDELLYGDLGALSGSIAGGQSTCTQITRHFLERIREENGALCAFVEVYEDAALQLAAEADDALRRGARRGPFHGLPVAVKDLLDIRGKATSAGSRARGGGIASSTSDAVARLQSAGMIVLGKTHMVEYAFGGWGTNKWMGTPRNPWDATVHRIPGGSSSGSAVAVAAALAPCALGTDTGGSIRIPAALNGVVGLKPTKELVSTKGCFAHSHTLDSIGPLTRSVSDAHALLRLMLDSRYAGALDRINIEATPPVAVAVVKDIERLCQLDPDVVSLYGVAVEMLTEAGAGIEYVRLPLSLETIMDQSGQLVAYEAWSRHREYIVDESLPFDPYVRARILSGRLVSEQQYAVLLTAHARISGQFAEWIKDYAALLLPTVPRPAEAVDEIDPAGAEITIFTRLVNFAHGCAISVPVGLSASGLPIGMQLIGGAFGEPSILALARILERGACFNSRYRIPARRE